MAPAISISFAGRVAIGTPGKQGIESSLGCRAQVALAYLALERWRPVGRDELAEVVWGSDLPTTWRAALRGVVLRLRAALAAAGVDPVTTLTSGPGGYQIHLAPGSWVDVEVAEERLASARAALALDPRQARAAAQAAAGTLRGAFLIGAEGPWVERRRAQLAELHLQGLELLSEACAQCSDADGAVAAAEEAVALQPLRESAHRRAMYAHEGAGNRARALRAYERCRRLLAEELGVNPGPKTEDAYLALLGEEPPVSGARHEHRRTGNLPSPLTRFVGRSFERAEVEALLCSSRLLTVTGPGGSGKSRLGLEVAGDVEGDHADGAWLVELAGLGDGSLLAEHVGAVLGIAGTQHRGAVESLVEHLAARRSLLVLDNCEHLVSECASLVDRLLRSCPDLRIMATSREPLGVGGEAVWVIPPLTGPGADDGGSLGTLLRYDAVALFVDRALLADPGLDLEPLADAVATICRRLDGIPLALELAAARARAMTLPEIADRLDDRFRLLVGGSRTAPARHQTLRAALDWSFEALSDRERRLFVSLSVFAGGFTIEAAEAVCPDGTDGALDSLSRLVDKSLVIAERSGRRGRYRLLETMRQYGYGALVDAGLERAVRTAQLQWSAALAERAEAGLEGPDQATWLHVLDDEHDNLRGALDWAAARSPAPDGQRTAASLWRYWEIRGLLREGRARLEVLFDTDAPPSLEAKALNAAGVLAQSQGNHAAALTFYQRAYDLRRAIDDPVGMAASLNGLGNVAVGRDDLFTAREIFQQNLRTSRTLGDDRIMAASLMNLGVVAQLLFVSGRIDPAVGAAQAHALYLESLALYRRLGDQRGTSQALENLGAIAPYRGDDATAHVCLEESLVMRRELCDRSGIAASARFLGHLALKRGEYRAARSLHEECLAIERELGNELLMAADLASLAEIDVAQRSNR